MTDSTPPDPTVEALHELSDAFDKISEAYHQVALATSVVAREGANAEELAEKAQNASNQAVTIAREVRGIARSIEAGQKAQREAFERFEIRVLKEFGQLARRVDALEEASAPGANGHG